MAIECLVKALDNVNATYPNQNQLWKQGEIVLIKQSPAVWGSAEVPPNFWRITVEGIDMTDPQVVTWIEENIDENGDLITQRKVYLDLNLLPPPIRNDIQNDGYAIVAANRLNGFRDAIVSRVV